MNATAAELSPRTFQRFCALVYEKAGIHLGPQKEALVAARMGKTRLIANMGFVRP